MPKKWHGRLEDILDPDNVRAAYWTARLSCKRKDTWTIRRYKSDIVQNALCNTIRDGKYVPQPAFVFYLYEPINGKWRLIEAPTFETKLVEQMILNVFGNQICKFIHPYQCGSVPNKGQEFSRKIVRKWSHLPIKQKKYYVQGDIRQFFPSIRRDVAMREYERHIGDSRVVELIRHMMPHEVGQPLGNALVQATANLVYSRIMYEAQRFTKRIISQMDDFVALFSNKRKAKQFIEHMIAFVRDKLGLVIKTTGKAAVQIWHWSKRAINISGYITSFFGMQKIRRHTYLKIRKCFSLASISSGQCRSFLSRSGLVKHTDSRELLDKINNTELRLNMRSIVSKEDKKRYESAA